MGMWFTEKLPETPPAIIQQRETPVVPPVAAPAPKVAAPAPMTRPSLPVVTIPSNLPPALRRLITVQRGGLHSVLQQIAAQIGWKARFVNSYPMALTGDGLPWGTPVPAYSMLYWISALPAISIGADAQTDTLTVSQQSLTNTPAPNATKAWAPPKGFVHWS